MTMDLRGMRASVAAADAAGWMGRAEPQSVRLAGDKSGKGRQMASEFSSNPVTPCTNTGYRSCPVMTIRGIVGLNIRRVRLEKAISQQDLALNAGIARSYMSGLERGNKNPTVEVLERIADVLGVTVGDLVSPGKEAKPKTLSRGRHVKRD